MGHIEWTGALSVGIEAIDAQHRRLIDIINRLDDETAASGHESGLSALLVELDDYAREHFSIEEEAFDETGYPGRRSHKAEHDAFIGKLADFRKSLAGHGGAAGKIDMSAGEAESGTDPRPEAAMLAFLRSWLTRHISFSDKRYKPWLAGRF